MSLIRLHVGVFKVLVDYDMLDDMSESDIDQLFDNSDLDHSGRIDYKGKNYSSWLQVICLTKS